MEIEKMMNLFNKNKFEILLSPFAQSYKQTISVFWDEVPDTSYYIVELWILNSTKVKLTSDKEADINAIKEKENLKTMEIGKQLRTREFAIMNQIVKISKVGIKNIYRIYVKMIDRNTNIISFSHLTPNRYAVRVKAEDQYGKELAVAKCIEIELVEELTRHLSSFSGGGYGYSYYPMINRTPKLWEKEEYYEEL